MAVLGDVIFRGSSLWQLLAGNTSTTRKFLRQTGTGSASAAPAWDQVTDADLSTSDITTNNVSITKHGFAPKAPNDATKYLDGTGAWTVPAGGGGASALDDLTDVTITTPATNDVLKYNGSAWVNGASSGGGINAYYPAFTTPVNGDFAWVNQGSAAVTVNGNGGIFLSYSGAVGGMRIRKKSAPSTPYTVTAALLPAMMGTLSNNCGIGFRESSSGKLHCAFLQWESGPPNFYSAKFSSPSSFSASYSTNIWGADGNGLLWLRISDDGTNRKVWFSADGYNWLLYTSVGRTDFLTADEICWFVGNNSTSFDVGVTLLSWAEA